MGRREAKDGAICCGVVACAVPLCGPRPWTEWIRYERAKGAKESTEFKWNEAWDNSQKRFHAYRYFYRKGEELHPPFLMKEQPGNAKRSHLPLCLVVHIREMYPG
jgi:hypothetical protein